MLLSCFVSLSIICAKVDMYAVVEACRSALGQTASIMSFRLAEILGYSSRAMLSVFMNKGGGSPRYVTTNMCCKTENQPIELCGESEQSNGESTLGPELRLTTQ